jgi:hypothetical protein
MRISDARHCQPSEPILDVVRVDHHLDLRVQDEHVDHHLDLQVQDEHINERYGYITKKAAEYVRNRWWWCYNCQSRNSEG